MEEKGRLLNRPDRNIKPIFEISVCSKYDGPQSQLKGESQTTVIGHQDPRGDRVQLHRRCK